MRVTAYPLKVNVNTTCECGHLVHVEDRIVGGSMTTPHLYPWMVAILNGGRLHCGMHDRVQMEEGTEKFIKIDSLIIHESFTSDYLHDTDDIGLVKLKEPIVWDETIQPICLPKPGSDYRGKLGMVTGWGRTAQNGNPARYLRRAGVKIVHEDRCKNTTIGDHIRETMLCAYEYNTDACQGDSGGPLGYETKTGMVEQDW
uniref:(California timema) hypothetical protein n=1 Tax=Timema californicum TaxID=61474 RepID=A0A7R9JAB7_TIMCA|nr:unnamed protein product [Timema californicum]